MTIELNKEARQEAIASIERYFRENMDEPIGNIAAGALLGFVLEEIGPAIYNQAVADVQERRDALQAKWSQEREAIQGISATRGVAFSAFT